METLAITAAVISLVLIVRSRQRSIAATRERIRQRNIARQQRLIMQGKRRARIVRSEWTANRDMARSVD